MLLLINPRMRTRYLTVFAFLHPPRLTLNVSKRSVTRSRPNVRRGGGKRGPRGGNRAQGGHIVSYPHTRVKLQSLVSDFSCFQPTGLRRSRDRDFQQTPTVGPRHVAYRKPNSAAGGRHARDLCARTCTRDGGGGTVEFDKKLTARNAVSSAGAASRGDQTGTVETEVPRC